MIRDDRELLAELARLNTDLVPLAMRVMDGSAHAAEQAHFAHRLISAGERLQRRADAMNHPVIDGEILTGESLTLPTHTAEPHRESPVVHNTTSNPSPAGRGGRPGKSPPANRTLLPGGA